MGFNTQWIVGADGYWHNIPDVQLEGPPNLIQCTHINNIIIMYNRTVSSRFRNSNQPNNFHCLKSKKKFI